MKGGKGRRKGRHASTQAPVRNNLFLLCLDMGCLPRNPNKIPKIKNFIVFSCVAMSLESVFPLGVSIFRIYWLLVGSLSYPHKNIQFISL